MRLKCAPKKNSMNEFETERKMEHRENGKEIKNEMETD